MLRLPWSQQSFASVTVIAIGGRWLGVNLLVGGFTNEEMEFPSVRRCITFLQKLGFSSNPRFFSRLDCRPAMLSWSLSSN